MDNDISPPKGGGGGGGGGGSGGGGGGGVKTTGPGMQSRAMDSSDDEGEGLV